MQTEVTVEGPAVLLMKGCGQEGTAKISVMEGCGQEGTAMMGSCGQEGAAMISKRIMAKASLVKALLPAEVARAMITQGNQ